MDTININTNKINDNKKTLYCMPSIDEHGFLRKNQLNDLYGSLTEIYCLLNGYLDTTDFADKIITYNKTYLYKRLKLLIDAENAGMKMIYSFENNGTKYYSVFLDNLYLDKAYLYAYIFYYTKHYLSPLEQRKLSVPFSYYPYVLGKLLNYRERDIRGFYILKYIITWHKSQSPAIHKILQKIRKDTEISIQNIDIKAYQSLYKKQYHAIKNYDDFTHFDTLYNNMRIKANQFFNKILSTKKFIKFKKERRPIPFKFNLKTLLGKNNRLYTPSIRDKINKIYKHSKHSKYH